MPSKCPQKQILCPSGYLVPEAFETQHKPKMNEIIAEMRQIIQNIEDEFDMSLTDEDATTLTQDCHGVWHLHNAINEYLENVNNPL